MSSHYKPTYIRIDYKITGDTTRRWLNFKHELSRFDSKQKRLKDAELEAKRRIERMELRLNKKINITGIKVHFIKPTSWKKGEWYLPQPAQTKKNQVETKQYYVRVVYRLRGDTADRWYDSTCHIPILDNETEEARKDKAHRAIINELRESFDGDKDIMEPKPRSHTWDYPPSNWQLGARRRDEILLDTVEELNPYNQSKTYWVRLIYVVVDHWGNESLAFYFDMQVDETKGERAAGEKAKLIFEKSMQYELPKEENCQVNGVVVSAEQPDDWNPGRWSVPFNTGSRELD